QQLRPHEVDAEIAVAEAEPALAAELGDRLERAPRLAGASPTPLVVAEAREPVDDAVEVGADVQAEDLDVVRDVPYDGDVVWFDYNGHAPKEPGSPDAAGEDGHLHAAAPASSCASTRRVCGPSRVRRRSRSPTVSTSSTRFGTSSSRDGASAPNRAALPGP